MFSKVAGAFVVVSVLLGELKVTLKICLFFAILFSCGSAAEDSASFSFKEGDCHDYNKSPPFRLCTFIESTKEEVGHGWTCSNFGKSAVPN